MTARIVSNLPASVFARLKSAAQKNRIDVQFLLTRYFIERFLYRLAHSPERANFILKGAMLFTVCGVGNSRMKDFADLWVLQSEFSFDGAALADAIVKTFARRSTPVPVETPVGLTPEWAGAANQERMWRAFLTRSGLEWPATAFADVVDRLADFLMAPALAAGTQHAFDSRWIAGGSAWISGEH